MKKCKHHHEVSIKGKGYTLVSMCKCGAHRIKVGYKRGKWYLPGDPAFILRVKQIKFYEYGG